VHDQSCVIVTQTRPGNFQRENRETREEGRDLPPFAYRSAADRFAPSTHAWRCRFCLSPISETQPSSFQRVGYATASSGSLLGKLPLEISDLFFLRAVPSATDHLRNALLTAFEDIAHLLNRTAIRVPQTPPCPTGSERDPISGIFTRLGSEQKRQPASYSKTNHQT